MPENFDSAKSMLRAQVMPRFPMVDLYCGCAFDRSLRVDLRTCPMRTDQFANRQGRIEFEHIVPASDFGRQRSCWREKLDGVDGRTNCQRTDPEYNRMEADPHNLVPVIGALNAIRSNHRFGMVSAGTELPIVQGCGFKVSRPPGRFIEPPDSVKGLVARTYFYMEYRYGLGISRSQRQLFEAWDRQFPPGALEIERAKRVGTITGVTQPFSVAR